MSVKWKIFTYFNNNQSIYIEAPAFWVGCNESNEKWNNAPGKRQMATVVGGEGHGRCKPKGTPQNYKRTHVNIFANVEREREGEKELN